MGKFKITVLGNTQPRRTEAEIEFETPNGKIEIAAVVYETPEGWKTEHFSKIPLEKEDELNATIIMAKERLSHYVNRMGLNCPEGLTVAGLSFWLMENDDGTAMGMPL